MGFPRAPEGSVWERLLGLKVKLFILALVLRRHGPTLSLLIVSFSVPHGKGGRKVAMVTNRLGLWLLEGFVWIEA